MSLYSLHWHYSHSSYTSIDHGSAWYRTMKPMPFSFVWIISISGGFIRPAHQLHPLVLLEYQLGTYTAALHYHGSNSVQKQLQDVFIGLRDLHASYSYTVMNFLLSSFFDNCDINLQFVFADPHKEASQHHKTRSQFSQEPQYIYTCYIGNQDRLPMISRSIYIVQLQMYTEITIINLIKRFP